MIELLNPEKTTTTQYLSAFFFENQPTKIISDEFLFGLQNSFGIKYIVLKEEFDGIIWGRVLVSELPRQNLYVDAESKGIREYLEARLLEGYKVFAFKKSQYKEYLHWLAE